MFCPSCRSAVESGQPVCPSCGVRIWSPVAPTVPVPVVEAVTEVVTDVVPTTSWPPPAGDPTPLSAPLPVIAYEGPAWEVEIALPPRQPIDTAVLPVSPDAPTTPTPLPNLLGARRSVVVLLVVGVVASGLALAGALIDFASIAVTGPDLPSVTWRLDDMASNLVIATSIAAGLLAVGAATGVMLRRRRSGGGARLAIGVAGGAGLALAGLAVHTIGQTIDAFDEVKTLLVQTGQSYTLRTTTEVGFWLFAAAGALGVAVFVLACVALRQSPVVGSARAMLAASIVGSLATLAAAVGPTIPLHSASYLDQFYNDGTPPLTSILRAIGLLLVVIGGVTGFAVRRPWGLAMALGTASAAIWQTVSTLLEVGNRPAGFAGGNPTTVPVRVPQPHLVTGLGFGVMVLAVLVGYTAALARRTASAATR